MANSVVILIILAYTFIYAVLSNVDCITVKSTISATNDDALASASCPASHITLVSCGGSTNDSLALRFDGTYIDTTAVPTKCYAQNAGASAGVYAYARCCNFISNDIKCQYITSSTFSSTTNDAIRTTRCGTSSYDTMLGCTGFTPWAYLDGAYPGHSGVRPDTISQFDEHNYDAYAQCTAQNGNPGGGVKANLACCESPTYPMSCILRYGTPFYPYSSVKCPIGYFMTGCSGWGLFGTNAWFIRHNVCYARSKHSENVYSVAICCQLNTVSPTTHPTPAPTEQPTQIPTPSPTSIPTMNPSNTPTAIPTISPTFMPTMSPSDTPTESPTYNPSMFPTDNPSISPTNNPTITPTKAPTTSPTFSPISTITQFIHVPLPKQQNNTDSMVMGGLIAALVFLVLCICCLGLLFIIYFWKKKKNMNDGIDDIQRGERMSVISNVPSIDPIEGSRTAGVGKKTMTQHGYDTLGQTENAQTMLSSSNKKEKLNLLADHSSDDDEDLDKMYDRNNSSKRTNNGKHCLDLDDKDEDIDDDDDNEDILK